MARTGTKTVRRITLRLRRMKASYKIKAVRVKARFREKIVAMRKRQAVRLMAQRQKAGYFKSRVNVYKDRISSMERTIKDVKNIKPAIVEIAYCAPFIEDKPASKFVANSSRDGLTCEGAD